MSQTLKNILKAKSFDKRITILFNDNEAPIGEELGACLAAIIEKARKGEQFAQIAWMCERKNYDFPEILSTCVTKAIDHPEQTGKAIRSLYFNGHKSEAIKAWEDMLKKYTTGHKSYYAQTLAFGHWFPETAILTKDLIERFLATSEEAKKYESLTRPQPAPNYNFI